MPVVAADMIGAVEKFGLDSIPEIRIEALTDFCDEDFAWFFPLPV